jgi:hypothetical protein
VLVAPRTLGAGSPKPSQKQKKIRGIGGARCR